MQCRKCKTENRACAKYCKSCRNEFTEQEQNKAKNKSIEGIIVRILERKDKIKSYVSLSFITDKIWFQVLSILLVLGIGVYFSLQNGIHLRIEKSDAYQINYNQKLEEYYLLVKGEEAKLNLYIPYQGQDVTVKHMEGEIEVSSTIYQEKDEITLMSNNENDYYLIIGKGLGSKEEVLKVYIYKEGEVEHEAN